MEKHKLNVCKMNFKVTDAAQEIENLNSSFRFIFLHWPSVLIACGVPQGSVLGPVLLISKPFSSCNKSHQASHQSYANDMQLCHSTSPESHSSTSTIEACNTNDKDFMVKKHSIKRKPFYAREEINLHSFVQMTRWVKPSALCHLSGIWNCCCRQDSW